ncbi:MULTISPECIES: hypothetical protein [Vibrio]|jgi:hypothetical protein|uniref:hypothetical protein n=1 Tax=Vibrio TaxID=662 RepID=UPI000BFFBFE8|nr:MULTISPECIES: hypothetical protein [unclassified Vibrio]PHJ42860.1 hypothetical protein AK965_03975 [Vibrio sp. PID17_43]RIZ54183.1 hypothetical protein AK966_10825 [Vibrio sp. PID23_8]
MSFKTDFDAFINQSWQQHEAEPELVYNQLEHALGEVEDANHAERILPLMLHTSVGHLNDPKQFITSLDKLENGVATECLARQRAKSVAQYFFDGSDTGMALLAEVDQRRVFAQIANELSAMNKLQQASEWLTKAVSGLNSGSVAEPLARSIAITGNNLACQYEELSERTATQIQHMLEAAALALEYWKVAGGWMQEERAEYRLAMSLLKAGEPKKAKIHAERCEEICQHNGGDAFELFCANDLLMLVHYHLSQINKQQLGLDMQQYCVNSTLA